MLKWVSIASERFLEMYVVVLDNKSMWVKDFKDIALHVWYAYHYK